MGACTNGSGAREGVAGITTTRIPVDTRTRRYKDFPPGWGHIKVPVSSRRATLAGLALYTPCLPRGAWAQRIALACVTVFGPTALPGRRHAWSPMDEEEWLELSDAWRRELGSFDDVVGYHRLQASRGGLALLLLHKGTPMAFVKLRRDDSGSLLTETIAMQAAWSYRPTTFQVPEPLRSGSASGWRYLACAPLPAGPHHPPRNPPLPAILEEIEAALAGLPRPTRTPAHWRPMHGDFAPWNLRQMRGGSLALIDWENAGWGPPGADEVFYRATQSALRRQLAGPCDAPEAIRFWCERVSMQPENSRDGRLAHALREAFDRMAVS